MTDKAKQTVWYEPGGRVTFIDVAKFEAIAERYKMIPILERKVIDAALAYHETVKLHTTHGVALESIHLYFDECGKCGEANGNLLMAVDKLRVTLDTIRK